jgi:hypothetical protein
MTSLHTPPEIPTASEAQYLDPQDRTLAHTRHANSHTYITQIKTETQTQLTMKTAMSTSPKVSGAHLRLHNAQTCTQAQRHTDTYTHTHTHTHKMINNIKGIASPCHSAGTVVASCPVSQSRFLKTTHRCRPATAFHFLYTNKCGQGTGSTVSDASALHCPCALASGLVLQLSRLMLPALTKVLSGVGLIEQSVDWRLGMRAG